MHIEQRLEVSNVVLGKDLEEVRKSPSRSVVMSVLSSFGLGSDDLYMSTVFRRCVFCTALKMRFLRHGN